MTRLRSITAVTIGAAICAAVQLVPASAAPAGAQPALPTGGSTVIVDVHSGELLSVTSSKPLPPAVVEQFDRLPGAKHYTQDAHTGGILAISRS
ncbi:hypothetical protein E0H75_42205 [Kribbella capetownensis]|uniref:D-alanyl-D-alanine carboxypeptidase n=1 Tax=Kribbella capetownensis TaxID=1572659 RepID=A0A4R0INF0_9ACTN|nr:hypothetical protein [Kribbella capetownensis]TCC33874.1 hypothetical protein E0H75_42205 [Kribbella capetownensis]